MYLSFYILGVNLHHGLHICDLHLQEHLPSAYRHDLKRMKPCVGRMRFFGFLFKKLVEMREEYQFTSESRIIATLII